MTSVSTDTLRHYERMRVLQLPRRTSSRYRQYPPEAADRVQLFRRAMALGFSLEELSKILTVRDRGGARAGEFGRWQFRNCPSSTAR